MKMGGGKETKNTHLVQGLLLPSLVWHEDGGSAGGSRHRPEVLVVRLLWCKKKKFVV